MKPRELLKDELEMRLDLIARWCNEGKISREQFGLALLEEWRKYKAMCRALNLEELPC